MFNFILCSILLLSLNFVSKNYHFRIIDKTIEYSGFNQGKILFFSDHHHLHFLTAIDIFKDNILIGSGPKSFRNLCNKEEYLKDYSDINKDYLKKDFYNNVQPSEKFRINTLTGCSTHPHHFYTQILSETGIIGFAFFIIFMFFIINKIFSLDKSYRYYDFYMILLITVLLNFSPFVTSGNFFNNYLSIMYFIPISFIYSLDY